MFQCFISQLCCFDFILTFLHCEFDALCHHFNKAFMYVCMYEGRGNVKDGEGKRRTVKQRLFPNMHKRRSQGLGLQPPDSGKAVIFRTKANFFRAEASSQKWKKCILRINDLVTSTIWTATLPRDRCWATVYAAFMRNTVLSRRPKR